MGVRQTGLQFLNVRSSPSFPPEAVSPSWSAECKSGRGPFSVGLRCAKLSRARIATLSLPSHAQGGPTHSDEETGIATN